MAVVVIGVNHRTAPVQIRERLTFAPTEVPPALAALREEGLGEEAVLLSTCNRIELYLNTPLDSATLSRAIREFIEQHRAVAPLDPATLYLLEEPHSLEHLCRVAAGLDSMVLGETEILGQLKQAYDLALRAGATGRLLNRAFQRAFNIAKLLRTETQIQRGTVSVSSVAVELAGRIFETLARSIVLVIGAGDTGEKAARALLSRGAKGLRVSNRSFERAEALATQLGGQPVPFDRWPGELAHVDIVITSTAAPHFILDRPLLEPRLPARNHQPLLLIDIAVPRDIDPEVNLLEGVFLYNIDDLQSIAAEARRQRQEEVEHCESLIRERVRDLLSTPVPTASEPSRQAPCPG